MKTLSQYRDEIKSLMKKAVDIDTKATNENRDLNDAELALKNEILSAVEETRKIVQVQERQERLHAELDAPANPPASMPEKRAALTIEVRDQDKFKSFGEQLVAVRRAAMPGGHVDPRLYNTRAATGLNEGTPSDGGLI